MSIQRIPLFPLNVVLFPEMVLPLHIFEDRYRRMIQSCLEGSGTFGVCLIQEGEEVGGSAVPHSIGTLCQIISQQPREDGRIDIVTEGRRRFRILRLHQDQPYLEGDVEFFEDQAGEDLGKLPDQVRDLALEFLGEALALEGRRASGLEFPSDAEMLSHSVSAFLPVEAPLRQELLELQDTGERLRKQILILRAGLKALEVIRSRRESQGGPARRLRVDPQTLCNN